MDFSKLGRIDSGGRAGRDQQRSADGRLHERGGVAADARTGYVTFFSRTRQQLWMKGETSGNRLLVRQVLLDCDEDTVLIKVRREGDGNVCHYRAASAASCTVRRRTRKSEERR